MSREVPDHLPGDLRPSTVDGLADTIQGLCNESALSRAEIIGALAAVQYALLSSWRAEADAEG